MPQEVATGTSRRPGLAGDSDSGHQHVRAVALGIRRGPYFGVTFLIAAILAILRGHIFTHPFRLVLVAVRW